MFRWAVFSGHSVYMRHSSRTEHVCVPYGANAAVDGVLLTLRGCRVRANTLEPLTGLECTADIAYYVFGPVYTYVLYNNVHMMANANYDVEPQHCRPTTLIDVGPSLLPVRRRGTLIDLTSFYLLIYSANIVDLSFVHDCEKTHVDICCIIIIMLPRLKLKLGAWS